MAAKRKKGLSLDEKRAVMLGIFHESKEVFNLKELVRGARRGRGHGRVRSAAALTSTRRARPRAARVGTQPARHAWT